MQNNIQINYLKESVLLLIYTTIKDNDYNHFGWNESIHMPCPLKMPLTIPHS